jgi:hypothetical protein
MVSKTRGRKWDLISDMFLHRPNNMIHACLDCSEIKTLMKNITKDVKEDKTFCNSDQLNTEGSLRGLWSININSMIYVEFETLLWQLMIIPYGFFLLSPIVSTALNNFQNLILRFLLLVCIFCILSLSRHDRLFLQLHREGLSLL